MSGSIFDYSKDDQDGITEMHCVCGETYYLDEPEDKSWAECPDCELPAWLIKPMEEKDSEIARLRAENNYMREILTSIAGHASDGCPEEQHMIELAQRALRGGI